MSIDYNDPKFDDLQNKPKLRKATKPSDRKDIKPPSLEEALQLLKSLGFSVVIPGTSEDIQRHEESVEKLGFIGEKKPVRERRLHKLIFTLVTSHCISGQVYGPGRVELDLDQTDLQRTLLQQDQSCTRGHMDTVHYAPVGQCYLITPGNGKDQHNKFRKRAIPEHLFSEALLQLDAAVSTSRYDVAGYQPNFESENRDF